MSKSYYSLGLMSGTSMDGVDASVIQTDGKSKYKAILDKYFEYPKNIYNNLTTLRDKIKRSKDLKKHQKQIKSVEKEITIFHAKAVNEILKKKKTNIDFIGFHGQTIFHNKAEKISKQLGDGKLLSKLTKKTVIYDFRQNDLRNGGRGAPLAPIFHQFIVKQIKVNLPVTILNIGGIANYTYIKNYKLKDVIASDIGPGNCLIDEWIRKKTKNKFDNKGLIAKKGKIDKISLEAIDFYNSQVFNYIKSGNDKNWKPKLSFDIKDFKFLDSFNELSLEDGAATLTELTSRRLDCIIHSDKEKIILCGGGRKNNFLVEKLKKKSKKIKLIDDYGINGDFVESQAFAYLAIRSFLKLPISFPSTTGCKKPCTGGVIIKNF
tara:strand:- start:1606 stop:2736 length:1131 start_codon:yes stop_codon:yes gene_type:complete